MNNLREALRKIIQTHNLSGQNIRVRCKALSAAEAIGKPENDDYRSSKDGVMVEKLISRGKRTSIYRYFEMWIMLLVTC
jgi:UDP-glucose 6-dehydrogenase